ncbi:hypothetical protein TNCT_446621 [Trichonephila clavata]|uniref:C2H2-type domain-containing protein n=1 Tax=Trichonephila clavata TaxID=2740835 RepID=A0A8X6LBB0_TRICU|nr:hypothetical protein TNCT_446621 [Trichonephila clavata]
MNTTSGSTISSPSPVALRTRTALADLQDALKGRKCVICGLVLNDLNELRAHILSHPTGAKRRQALCFFDRLVHSPIMVSISACVPPAQTPRTSPVPVPETGSPDETLPGSETINSQITKMDTEDIPSHSTLKTKPASPARPVFPEPKQWTDHLALRVTSTLNDQALELSVRHNLEGAEDDHPAALSSQSYIQKTEIAAKSPTKDAETQCEVDILQLLLGSQDYTELDASPQGNPLGTPATESSLLSSNTGTIFSPITGPPRVAAFSNLRNKPRRSLHRCTKCSMAFYSSSALEAHMLEEQVLENVVKDIPQAKAPGSSDDFTQGYAETPRSGTTLTRKRRRNKRAPMNSVSDSKQDTCSSRCNRCRVTFLSRAALTEHNLCFHKKSVAQNANSSAPKPKDCRWCDDCNNYIPESISMAGHIARRHNVKKAIDSRDKMHTELIGIHPENITDASVPHGTATFSIASTVAPALRCQYCEATFKSPARLQSHVNWHLQDAPHPREVLKVARVPLLPLLPSTTSGTTAGSSTAPPSLPPPSDTQTCHKCGSTTTTRKGMVYHMLQVHGVPLPKKQRPGNSQDTSVAHQNPEVVGLQMESISICTPGVIIHGQTLRYTFPIPHEVKCPIVNCKHTFRTQKWYTTNTSLKRHLTAVHRLPHLQMEPWCAHCSTRLRTAPAAHPCFKNSSLMQGGTREGTWSCADCDFVATTRNGLLNHAKVHKRARLREDIPPLLIPLDPKTRRRNKRKKLASLTTGQPGDTPLASPAIDLPASEDLSREEENATRWRERIDVLEPSSRFKSHSTCYSARKTYKTGRTTSKHLYRGSPQLYKVTSTSVDLLSSGPVAHGRA